MPILVNMFSATKILGRKRTKPRRFQSGPTQDKHDGRLQFYQTLKQDENWHLSGI